jgi:outer membrane protein OmpA-like peptidoglycan-associated protein
MFKAILKSNINLLVIVLITLICSSCKSKKAITPQKNAPNETSMAIEAPKPIEPVKPADSDNDGVTDDKDNCPDEKGLASNDGCPKTDVKVLNYKNIQFEFNSSVLKTSSYAVLDAISQQMKKRPSAKFQLDGHSSAEGSDQRNMMLSVDRANAVKSYLVNNGIKNVNLLTKGYGEAKPIVANTSEANKALNRRVEIKVF